MTIHAKMKTICDNIRLRTGGTELLNLDKIAEAILTIGGNVDMESWVHNAIGTTFPSSQLPADSRIDGSDIYVNLYVENGNVLPTDGATSDDIHAYIDTVTNSLSNRVTKEILGKDESGNFDIARYTVCNRQHIAWQKQNYPKMYAWKDNSGGELVPNFTNLKDQCVFKYNQRYSLSGGAWKSATASYKLTGLVIPIPSGKTSVTIRLKNATPNSSYTAIYYGTSVDSFSASAIPSGTEFTNQYYPEVDGVRTIVCTVATNTTHVVLNLTGTSASDFTDIIITVDEPIEYVTVGGGTIYSTSISPRIGDTLYTTPYVGTSKGIVSTVNATNRSRTVDGVEYVRYESGDIEPTVIYTDIDDDRNSNATITQDGATYNRYPIGDLLANREKPIPIFIYANEHGTRNSDAISNGTNETKLCALVASRMIRDFALKKQSGNPLFYYILENCMLIVIPIVNVYGFNHYVTDVVPQNKDSYRNANAVNINRNYDTPGWDVMNADSSESYWMGAYAGSENETQYVMNTMVESGSVVAMSLHGLGGYIGYCAHQGQSPDGSDYNREKLTKVNDILYDNYGIRLRYYDLNTDGTPKVAVNTPDITSKSPSYITQCGAYGGIVEFQPVKAGGVKGEQYLDSDVVECAYAQTLNLMAMWLSDYLEQ